MEEDFNSVFDENQETNDETNICLKRNRVILHFDIDCFYAQVEMIKDPSLASKPLGIQQKNIVVTCNYIAREKGVGKCTWIPDAKKACPELVLVNGEDLADYRRWSQQIFDLIYRNTGYENFNLCSVCTDYIVQYFF
jgi:nucleotidyltransferase/DNA polymerase involved in DNA repair